MTILGCFGGTTIFGTPHIAKLKTHPRIPEEFAIFEQTESHLTFADRCRDGMGVLPAPPGQPFCCSGMVENSTKRSGELGGDWNSANRSVQKISESGDAHGRKSLIAIHFELEMFLM